MASAGSSRRPSPGNLGGFQGRTGSSQPQARPDSGVVLPAGSSRLQRPGRSGAFQGYSGDSHPQARPYSGDVPPRLPPAPAIPRPSYAAVARAAPGGLLKPSRPQPELQEVPGSKACSVTMGEQRNPSQWIQLRESLFSVFIDRIPMGKDGKWLRALFSKEGRVMDVFIPTRWRRGSKTRFGFVRYKSRVEAIDAVRSLNGRCVGNDKLVVKLADDGGKPTQERRGIKNREGTGYALGNRASENVRRWRPKQTESRVDGGSPAENSSALIKRNLISLDVVPENEVWLKLCVVGELKEHVSVDQLKEELRNQAIGFYKVFPMAGQRMMINFSTQEELDKFLSENYPLVLKRFSKIHLWKEDAMPKSRSIWISVTGLPFKAWSESNYAKLAALFGRYLRMDDRSKQFTGLDRARFLVETTLIGSISKSIEAEIGGKVYQLGVFEDCFLSGCETEGLLKDESSEEQEKNHSSTGDSNEITSRRQGNDEIVAETQSENAVGEGNRPTKLISGDIEITSRVGPEGGQVKGICDTIMERNRNSNEGSRFEVDEIEEIPSEDDSVMSMEKIQNRLKVLRRKTAKDKEVVKYKRRMARRCEKTQIDASFSLPRTLDAGPREEAQIMMQEGEQEEAVENHEKCIGAGKDKEVSMAERRKEAEMTWELGKALGLEADAPDEEVIQMFMDQQTRNQKQGCVMQRE